MKYASTGNVGTYSKKIGTRVIQLQNENESNDNQCKTTNTGGGNFRSKPAIQTNFLLSNHNIETQVQGSILSSEFQQKMINATAQDNQNTITMSAGNISDKGAIEIQTE